MQRPSHRATNALRTVEFHRHYTQHAAGSVLACFGHTKVLCTASIDKGVPKFIAGKGQGWLTAEYSMLPSATHQRVNREAARGKQTGRTIEIQRLIGRSLRAAIDLKKLGEYTITIDCDVIQADGGTRTTAISGACVALVDALTTLQQQKRIKENPLRHLIAAVSVGIYQQTPILDLDYAEDAHCDTDMNIIMTEHQQFIEIQGTAEGAPFSTQELTALHTLARDGIADIIQRQRQALNLPVSHQENA